jgi:predicted membrane-bound spermidine synthase
MGVEMCSSRLMAPFFGTSITIWTTIIGSTMIALTAGYYLGGIIVERAPRASLLGTLLFFASVFVIFLPYITQPVMEITLGRFAEQAATSSGDPGAGSYKIIIALVLCAVLISVPVVILAMTSPFIIRLDSLTSTAVGRIAGKVFAYSTLGSILGTFLPALVLIPLVGTRLSFLVFGGLLLCVTLWSIKQARFFFWGMAFLVLLFALMLGIRGAGTKHGPYLVESKETNYQLVRIYRAPMENKTGGNRPYATFLLTEAGLGMQSMWVEGQSYTESWQDLFAIVPRIYEVLNERSPGRLLVLGLGGACAPYLISRSYPDVIIDGVEIDSGLISAAKPHFPFSLVKHLNIHISGGRSFLKTTRTQYDVIIVDMFRPPHIPYHVATAEFFAQVKHRLTPNGILAMNVGSRGEKRVFGGIANTVAAVFPHVYFAQYFSPQESSLFTNRLIVASAQNLRLEKSEVEEMIFSVPDGAWRKVLETMRDRRGFDAGQESYFRKVPFDPGKTCFRDDSSSLEITAEREFLGLILGGNL